MELYVTGTGQRLWVHDEKKCVGDSCCIHRPSKHHMRGWAINYRSEYNHMERLCSHGVGHPDPDSVEFAKRFGKDLSVHGCDGCCSPPNADLKNGDLTKLSLILDSLTELD